MLQGVYILLDDDFDHPLHADPDVSEIDVDVWEAACEAVNDAIEGDAKPDGVLHKGDVLIAYKVHTRSGLSFVAFAGRDVGIRPLQAYLTRLSRRYFDEVDDVRHPERNGVEDVVVDVIPPWEE